METALLIALIAAAAALIIMAVFIIRSAGKKRYYRKDIHFSGGANLDNGQISSDNNYFKGITSEMRDTVVADSNYYGNSPFTLTIVNLNTSHSETVAVTGELVIGRNTGSGMFTVEGDNMISHRHCKLYVNKGRLYICDLNSSNHTFLNNGQITKPEKCVRDDIIRIGNTYLKLVF